jgi:hypothetical protein
LIILIPQNIGRKARRRKMGRMHPLWQFPLIIRRVKSKMYALVYIFKKEMSESIENK